ncbi:hypothetical protein ACF0H5_008840 [Mactra antiquata]
MAVNISHGVVILLCSAVTVTISMHSGMPGKFKLTDNILLENEPYAIFSNVHTGAACAAQCRLDNFCGYAQYSTLNSKCMLNKALECGLFIDAAGWVVYERAPIDITDYLIVNGAIMTQFGGQDENLIYSIDKVYTTSFYGSGSDAWWHMDFGNVWPVAKVVVTYTPCSFF